MIVGLSDNSALCILSKMMQSGHSFYLTGSRFFNTYDHDSDYDFFVKDSEDVRTFISQLQFRHVSSGYDPDSSISDVAQWKSRIHVQLVKPEFFETKIKAQDLIRRERLLDDAHTKREQLAIWRSVMTALRLTESPMRS